MKRSRRKSRAHEPELKSGTLEAIRELAKTQSPDLTKFYSIWRRGLVDQKLVSILFPG